MFDGVHGNGRELKRFPKRVEMQWGPSLNNGGPHDGSSVPLRLAPIDLTELDSGTRSAGSGQLHTS